MPILKDVLCIIGVLAAYAIAGQLDYEDAMALEERRNVTDLSAQFDCAVPPAPAGTATRESDGNLHPPPDGWALCPFQPRGDHAGH